MRVEKVETKTNLFYKRKGRGFTRATRLKVKDETISEPRQRSRRKHTDR
jgi:hypothetical protein